MNLECTAQRLAGPLENLITLRALHVPRQYIAARNVGRESFIFKWPRSDMSSDIYEPLMRGMRSTAGIYVAAINSADVSK